MRQQYQPDCREKGATYNIFRNTTKKTTFNKGVQFVPIGIPTIGWFNFSTKQNKNLIKEKSARHTKLLERPRSRTFMIHRSVSLQAR